MHGLATWVLLLIAAGCNNSKFKDSTGPTAEPTKPAPGPFTGAASVPTPGCTTTGTTVAKLLTQSVRNRAPGQIIKYELSMNDCQGVQTPITAREILFDVNAIFITATPGSMGGPLPYALATVEGSPLGSGTLEIVPGSDLFGKADPLHWHYRTGNPVNVPAQTNKIVMDVDISNTENHRPDIPITGTYPPTEIISTFLRFGNAAPVEQPVTFQN